MAHTLAWRMQWPPRMRWLMSVMLTVVVLVVFGAAASAVDAAWGAWDAWSHSCLIAGAKAVRNKPGATGTTQSGLAIIRTTTSIEDVERLLSLHNRVTIRAGSDEDENGPVDRLKARRREEPNAPGVPMAICFIEWPDNRWWFFKALVDPENAQIREDTAVILRAVEGDPMPGRLGRWWALGRRAGMHLHLNRTAPSDATPVH